MLLKLTDKAVHSRCCCRGAAGLAIGKDEGIAKGCPGASDAVIVFGTHESAVDLHANGNRQRGRGAGQTGSGRNLETLSHG